MFALLQGFAIGLFLSCPVWFLLGMYNPRVAVPHRPDQPPRRWQVLLRYWFIVPFIAFLIWLTSLWGGWGPSLAGWLLGLGALAVEVPLESRWRRFRARWQERRRERAREAEALKARARLEQQEREAGLAVLDPNRPPVDADAVVLGLCEAKGRLLTQHRPDLAVQADRLYSRYAHVGAVLADKFQPGELAHQRAAGLAAEVCRNATDQLNTMASLLRGVAGVDGEYVQRRLSRDGGKLSTEEREALHRRLALLEDTERRLRTLSGRNEAAVTALDDAAASIARLRTEPSQASVAADQALRELGRFMDQAQRYDRGERV
ncbi:cobyrinic acid a,c-diamide synthase [Alkalilimnicola sp. S0819]|uniref:cobyrinic acid a,c-diamide synthase n=1 Tax=Alkalilimnicola sp. S0819 TaxID=2613922 RepID=UPI0012620861|nr:cobyrinic acid a,c-diamide synthase [Alkalilimnicola sp. S0819]KAB7627676.1 cobyrinic acid a,c-diamide synthase [Alkalilimnicola sp. S0819]MPQ15843.1 cobyrinic acid a,c-diamide synthase [Alkalilimnicola sp. S0819]